MLALRPVAAGFGWFALGLQYWLLIRGVDRGQFVARTVAFFSYFTILSNLLFAMALTWPRGFLGRADVRAAIAGYGVIVAAVYHTVLAQLWDPQGWQWVADQLLHSLMPALFVLDWVCFVPKGTLRPAHAIRSLIVPVVYAAWVLLRGRVTGEYPYPFADVEKLGYATVSANMVLMLVAFALVGLALVGVDRALPRAVRFPDRVL